jgi:hypothetical protein
MNVRLDEDALVLLQAPVLFGLVGIGVLLKRVLDVGERGHWPVESRDIDLYVRFASLIRYKPCEWLCFEWHSSYRKDGHGNQM